jgi:hypothetical protein
MQRTHVVVDGSNIATEGRVLPSLAQLDEAVRAFLGERPHDICTVVVDATFEHRIDASERQMYDEALAANELLTPPAGSIGRGDKFILEIADRVDAIVFSNDSFQEFHGDYDWLFDEGRLVGGKPVPGVGWVFIERTPVRGPKSRIATRAASRKRTKATDTATATGPPAKRAARGTPRTSASASAVDLGPMPVPKAPPPGRTRTSKKKAAGATATAVAEAKEGPTRHVEPLNAPLPFIEFVADHQLGSAVEGEVVEFSSHGAYVQYGDVRLYAPLKLLGDPPPRSAREVLNRGDIRTFVVHAIHAARRGIDVALADGQTATGAPAGATGADQAPERSGAYLLESEATLAPTKKAPAKKAPAKKAPAKKAPAKKAPAKKAPAKKVPAKKAPAKRAPAKKAPAKKAPAKKAPAKKAPAKKTAAKKAPAKKATAKKTGARKAPAKKATARKATGAR